MNEKIEEILNFHINRKLRELNEKAKTVFGAGLVAPFSGKINNSMFRTVGLWHYTGKSHDISISGIVYDNISEYMNETIAHEFAHAYAFEHYRDGGHGKYWKYVMRMLGFTPNRTMTNAEATKINYVEKVADFRYNVKRYIYKCACRSEIKLSTTRHNRIQGGHNYWCNHCDALLEFTNKVVSK